MEFKRSRHINGAAVRVIREALGVRHMDLAARVGISRGSLSHVEGGSRQVSSATQRKLADALGIPLEAITYPAETSSERDKVPA